ncbi:MULTISPECIES: serine kinase [unclassified Mesorhizobium]|uniref:serine kinase n=1 Tax=unclassified Mesorhizobium TaxID=325217 RepID=UPI000FCA190A|nr:MULTISPECIES: serine kinase [unclassified Mesorhizobium]RUX93913.1 serine kinase [Mesorhizobium sp. M7D.F.Ca.US.004.01.2.1]RVA36970.1 serine kinase [Mesorhizobium sp. M7D.F.Ca.US.004.03.1.1]
MTPRNEPLAAYSDNPRPHGRVVRERRFYRAYGLTIASEVTLPELEPGAPGAADVVIAVGAIGLPTPSPEAATDFRFEPDRQYLAWHAVGAFLISDGRRIDIEPAPGVDDTLIAFPLLGPVMALLLHRRRLLVLHASAIAVAGTSAIFMGDKGAGKSTTASAMIRAGHQLLTDDVVALNLADPSEPMIVPGFPQIKLAADAAAAISLRQADVRPQVHPAIDKMQHRLNGGFSGETVPATRIYILERGERADITPLPAIAALPAIIKFSYVTRFGRAALPDDFAATHLRQCSWIANHVGVCRLEVPTGLDRIGEAVGLIERDLAAGSRRS